MKAKDLRELSTSELYAKLNEAQQELFNLRIQSATRQLTNYQRMGQVRRDIARIKTILRERQLQEAG